MQVHCLIPRASTRSITTNLSFRHGEPEFTLATLSYLGDVVDFNFSNVRSINKGAILDG